MKIDQREYHSVILGALLHDIGKLLHRGGDNYRGKHEEASLKFFINHEKKIKNDQLYDLELVQFLTQYHHGQKEETFNDTFLKSKERGEREYFWNLLKLIKRADSYSCAERDYEQDRKKGIDKTKAPLDSVFSNINLSGESRDKKDIFGYVLSPLSPFSGFPSRIKELDKQNIEDHIKQFEESLPDFSTFDNFYVVLNSWLDFLRKYTWNVASDTRYEISDVSLFDHLRSSAALAACLYKTHISSIKDKKFRLKKTQEFTVIGGDFSGIQNYIFEITNKGSGGASKRLRARSFFISIFAEVTIHKILHALDLPLLCNLFSAGGKFLLLAPNTGAEDTILKKIKTETDHEIHKTFFSQFSFLMTWMQVRNFRDETKTYHFFKLADEMFHKLETEKAGKSYHALINHETGNWKPGAFKADSLYEKYKERGDCKICGRGPAEPEHYKNLRVDDAEEKETCFLCYRDKFLIGQSLPITNYIVFNRGTLTKENEKGKILIFRGDAGDDYYVELLEQYENRDNSYLIYILNRDNNGRITSSICPPVTKYYANYVPSDGNRTLNFDDEISQRSRWIHNDKTYGSDLLGVLKADIDNLGLIFSKGFDDPGKQERDLPSIDRKTISRFLTLANMLELFFSGWIKEIMSGDYKPDVIKELAAIDGIDKKRLQKYLQGNEIDFRNIYTVYSGGDDMVLVGPWETMIVFTMYLNMQFRKYTCNNPFITLSAGLTFIKPKYPIASAIRQAEDLLEKSKKEGKDRITLFGSTVQWQHLPNLLDFFLFLNEKLNDENSKINSALVNRLLEYHRMAATFIEDGKIEGLKFASALSYDIGRNILGKRKTDENRKIEFKKLHELVMNKPDKSSLIYNSKIPIHWALYRNRKAT